MIVDEALAVIRRRGGETLRAAIAGDERLGQAELATRTDPGLFGPASIAWRVHGDAAMLIGGLRALLLQTLHPLAMAGVADHSDYRQDPWGRLHRTGRFVGATTFGNTETAEGVIKTVRAVHDRVEGHAPDGRPYSANDPHLLLWVHVTEVDSFLNAYDHYGSVRLTDDERDRYVAEMAVLALKLGSEQPPMTRAELTETIEAFRAECSGDAQAREALRFLLAPPVPLAARGIYGVITAAAVAGLPPWARQMLRLPLPPGLGSLAIHPSATALTRTLGWMMSDRSLDLDDHVLAS